MFTKSDTLPLDKVARMYPRLRRLSPATASGHGSSRCHARFKWSISASLSPSMPNSGRICSSADRCSSSSGFQGSSPRRTRSIEGRYRACQASANLAQSRLIPRDRPLASASRMIPERQSTTVPKTSKVSARTRRAGGSARGTFGATSGVQAHEKRGENADAVPQVFKAKILVGRVLVVVVVDDRQDEKGRAENVFQQIQRQAAPHIRQLHDLAFGGIAHHLCHRAG